MENFSIKRGNEIITLSDKEMTEMRHYIVAEKGYFSFEFYLENAEDINITPEEKTEMFADMDFLECITQQYEDKMYCDDNEPCINEMIAVEECIEIWRHLNNTNDSN